VESDEVLLFWTVKLPAVSSALEASRGRLVSTTEAAIVSGVSVVSLSSGIRSSAEVDILCGAIYSSVLCDVCVRGPMCEVYAG
jgi:hypothetical protein